MNAPSALPRLDLPALNCSGHKTPRSVWSGADLSPLCMRISHSSSAADAACSGQQKAAITRTHSKRWRARVKVFGKPLVLASNSGCAGFSLLEVMCAILILGVGLVGLTQGITAALSSNKESELQTSAALIAAGRIEILRAEGYVVDGQTEGVCGEGFSLYRWRQSVTGTDIDGLHEVEVVVENSKSGKVIYELRTLLFDPPIDSTLNESRERKDRAESRKQERRRR